MLEEPDGDEGGGTRHARVGMAAARTLAGFGAVAALTGFVLAGCFASTAQHPDVDASTFEASTGFDGMVAHESGVDATAEAGADATAGEAATDAAPVCTKTTDCPSGRACDVTTHSCTTACDTSQPCNAGCCSAATGGTCQAGAGTTACGNNGGLCASCTAGFAAGSSGKACEAVTGGGQCGCAGTVDCPSNSSGCDTTSGLCVYTCSGGSPCVAGCCGTGGTCLPGTSDIACGGSGSCVDCTGHTGSPHCIPGTLACGCTAATDCAGGQACNVTTHTCGAACGGAEDSACNGGCCDATAGQCVAGTANGACGATGAVCIGCSGGTPTCGSGGACTSACGGAGDGTCGSGNCCVGSACIADTSPLACGANCTNCTDQASGIACVGGVCGCSGSAGCIPGLACDLSTSSCGVACGTASYSACHGGCCYSSPTGAGSTCVGGGANNACGSGGAACFACSGLSPTCAAGACTTACGVSGDGTCGGGDCCVSNACVADTNPQGCGPNCTDCVGTKVGSACVSGGICGCNVAADCPPDNACLTSKHQCSNQCGAGFTACNGGCCGTPVGTVGLICLAACPGTQTCVGGTCQ